MQDEARRQDIQEFHEVLTDISYCQCTTAVRDFIVNAYVRGAWVAGGTAEHSPFEGKTAVPNAHMIVDYVLEANRLRTELLLIAGYSQRGDTEMLGTGA